MFSPNLATRSEAHSQTHSQITALTVTIEALRTEISGLFKHHDPFIQELVSAITMMDVPKGKNKTAGNEGDVEGGGGVRRRRWAGQ
jgi:hypothetical protein